MKMNFMVTALLGLLMTTNSAFVYADELPTTANTCNELISDVVISYTEGNDYLTATVQLENLAYKANTATVKFFSTLPDGTEAVISATPADTSVATIPMNGLGTYHVHADVKIEGCSNAISAENSMTIVDEATFFAYKTFLPTINTGKPQESEATAAVSRSMNACDSAIINGDNSDNILTGSNENADIIEGRNGDDTISGNGCGDILRGGRGKDTLSGGDGDDVLDGGKGFWWPKDTCIGGAGVDTFIECETAVQ